MKINKYFMQLYIHNVKFKCRTPCLTNKFTTELVHKTKSGNENNLLVIVFDRKIDISQSRFKIDEQTFVTRLGGSVSSGRTLLWILVGLLGTFQARFEKVSVKQGQGNQKFHFAQNSGWEGHTNGGISCQTLVMLLTNVPLHYIHIFPFQVFYRSIKFRD